ncbi:copper transpport protein [Thecaphora frezii]
MDHGHHDMPMPMPMPMPAHPCPMLMTWNTDTSNICIISSSWHIRTPRAFLIALFIVAFVSAAYEWLRLYTKATDAKIAASIETRLGGHRRRASVLPTASASALDSPSIASAASASGPAGRRARRSRVCPSPLPISKRAQIFRSTLYASSVFISFMLMLVAMTFNAWLIAAIVGGAGLGHYWFNRDLSRLADDDKGLACHL